MRAMERLLSLGCFPSFKSTLALSRPVKMSQIAESHVQYATYTAWIGHSAFLLQGDSLHSVWDSLQAPCAWSLWTTVSHLARLMSSSAQHPPGWVSATQMPTQTPSWIPAWYQHFSFRLCPLSLCAGGLLWGGEPRGTKEPNSGSAARDLLLPYSLHICMSLN